ncbi:MAG: LEA type 2 family protein [Alphaproteobacteria bacterium]|nr:LEA type 2 family protein [Alphaproteobacteria bacterium]
MIRRRSFLTLGLAFLASSCAMVGDVEPPIVSLADLRIGRMGLFEQEALVTLRLRNPNDQSLPLDGAKFNIKLNGEPFARGVSNESITVPRLGDATMKATMVISTFDVLNQFLNMGNIQALTYELDGTAFYSGLGLMRRSAPFTQVGKLKLGGNQSGNQIPGLNDKPGPKPMGEILMLEPL